MGKAKAAKSHGPWASWCDPPAGRTRPGLARHYRAAMAKVRDLLHEAPRTADREGNPFEVLVGVDGGVVQSPPRRW